MTYSLAAFDATESAKAPADSNFTRHDVEDLAYFLAAGSGPWCVGCSPGGKILQDPHCLAIGYIPNFGRWRPLGASRASRTPLKMAVYEVTMPALSSTMTEGRRPKRSGPDTNVNCLGRSPCLSYRQDRGVDQEHWRPRGRRRDSDGGGVGQG
eukprot:scaffold48_cov311-Pinguiococcus_pyrenoidosus.AAC.88